MKAMTTTPAPRDAARAILLDEQDRVMLLRYDENGGFWATPGGKVEDGETHPQAVARELAEELGIRAVDVGPHLATRVKDHLVAGQPVRQSERYYLARTDAASVSPPDATRPDNIQDHRWWTLDELTATEQTVYPVGLATLLEKILAAGMPPEPVALS
jgi:8-oxo-dGTP pyrophosphatase MutT (NUDIX family)